MKKLLLIGLALGIGLTGFSQKKVAKSNKEYAKNHTVTESEFSFNKQTSEATPKAIDFKADKAALLDRYEVGQSGNIYSVLTSYQRPIAYDAASGALLVSHRAEKDLYGANTTGTMMAHWSADMGATWSHNITLDPEDGSAWALRYPSGVIYNPDGSSNIDDVYAVQAGPSHNAGTWDNTFHAVSKSTGDNMSNHYWPWEGGEQNDWARSSMTTTPDAIYNFGQVYEAAGDLGINQTMKQYVGTTDDAAAGFDWEYNAVTPDWLETEGHSVALYTTWSAWSNDGMTGYMWLVGVSNDSYDYGVYQPQIMFTEDGGDSWDEVELDLEDHEVLVEYLPAAEDAAGNPTSVKPSFLTGDRTYPGVVDYQGNLHLFSNVFGSSKGDVLNADNGYWVVGDIKGGHIFDFVIDADGIQDVIFVDSIMTEETATDAFGDLGWAHRLQASKSVDGKKIFAVWTDDPGSESGTVRNPDIKAWGLNAASGFSTEPVNFTIDDLYGGFYFYIFVSELTPFVDGLYNIPITTTLTPAEFANNDVLAPCTHTLVSGIGFTEEQLISVDDVIASQSNISVTQNNPNPFNGTTTIKVTTETSTAVMVEVSNIMGQTIYTTNAGNVNGTKEITLSSNNMETGVYFYTVTVGNESITKKMIVK